MPESEQFLTGVAAGKQPELNPVEGPLRLTPIAALAIMYAHKTPIRASVDILFGANDQLGEFVASDLSPTNRPVLHQQSLSTGLSSMVQAGLLTYADPEMAQRYNKIYVAAPTLKPLVADFNILHTNIIAQQTGIPRSEVVQRSARMLRDAYLGDGQLPVDRVIAAVQQRTGASTEHITHRMLGSFAFINGCDVLVDERIRAQIRSHPYAVIGQQRRGWRVGRQSGGSK